MGLFGCTWFKKPTTTIDSLRRQLENDIIDLELWPRTLTYNPNLAKVKVNPHDKNQGQRSNGSRRRAGQTDRQTNTQTDATKRIISTASRSIKNAFEQSFRNLYCNYEKVYFTIYSEWTPCNMTCQKCIRGARPPSGTRGSFCTVCVLGNSSCVCALGWSSEGITEQCTTSWLPWSSTESPITSQ